MADSFDVDECVGKVTAALELGAGGEYSRQPPDEIWAAARASLTGMVNEIARLRGERIASADETVRELGQRVADGLTVMRDEEDEESWQLPDLETVNRGFGALGALVEQAGSRRRFNRALMRLSEERDRLTPEGVREYVSAVIAGQSWRTAPLDLTPVRKLPTIGPVHELDAGRYRVMWRDGVPLIERVDGAGAVIAVLVPCSREVVAEMSADWSAPARWRIVGGEFVFSTVDDGAALEAVLPGVVRALLHDYHGDHNWAQNARHDLDFALHQDEGCPVYRRDCPRCVESVAKATA